MIEKAADPVIIQGDDKQVIDQSNTYNKEYSEFIDLAVHELDAPLRKLSSFIEILTHKCGELSQNNDIQTYTGKIETSIHDMRSLIDDLSVFSTIVSKKGHYSFFEMETVVQQVLMDMKSLIAEKKANISISSLPAIEGDSRQYAQLLKNILENAIKFSKRTEPPEISVTSSVIDAEEKKHFNLIADSGYFKIEVRDNGIGFRKEYAEKIFLPFIRLNSKSQYKGNGIGLAVCKKIIENHCGVLYARSVENSGSCFVMILPQTISPTC